MRPDLILLDMVMPDEDGLTFLRSLRAAGNRRPCSSFPRSTLPPPRSTRFAPVSAWSPPRSRPFICSVSGISRSWAIRAIRAYIRTRARGHTRAVDNPAVLSLVGGWISGGGRIYAFLAPVIGERAEAAAGDRLEGILQHRRRRRRRTRLVHRRPPLPAKAAAAAALARRIPASTACSSTSITSTNSTAPQSSSR